MHKPSLSSSNRKYRDLYSGRSTSLQPASMSSVPRCRNSFLCCLSVAAWNAHCKQTRWRPCICGIVRRKMHFIQSRRIYTVTKYFSLMNTSNKGRQSCFFNLKWVRNLTAYLRTGRAFGRSPSMILKSEARTERSKFNISYDTSNSKDKMVD